MSFKPLIEIGFDDYDNPDFRIHGELREMDLERMQRLRAMIPVAIAEAERMWTEGRKDDPAYQGCGGWPTPMPFRMTKRGKNPDCYCGASRLPRSAGDLPQIHKSLWP